MDASTAFRPEFRRFGRQWAGAGSQLLLAVLLLTALLVAARRAAGELDRPLGFVSLWALAFFVAAVAAVARAAPRPALMAPLGTWFDWWLRIAPTISLVVIGVAVMLPGTSAIGLVGFWGIIIGQEFWSWQRELKRKTSPARQQSNQLTTSLKPQPQAIDRDEPPGVTAAPTTDATVWQRTTRLKSTGGVETVHGWIRCGFEAGQRVATSHLAFCPPLAGPLQIEHRQCGGPAARIKVAQLLPHGARLDIKLADPSDQHAEVVIECTIRETRVGRTTTTPADPR